MILFKRITIKEKKAAEATVKAFAIHTLNEMEAFINKNEVFATKSFHMKKRVVSFSKNRKRSWGGIWFGPGKLQYGVSLAVNRYLVTCTLEQFATGNGRRSFYEYAHIANHEVIGSCVNVHWQVALRALIAHEVAHALEHSGKVSETIVSENFKHRAPVVSGQRGRVKRIKGHGKLWQFIYAELRKEFVNYYKVKDLTKAVVAAKKTRKQKLTAKLICNIWNSYHGYRTQKKMVHYIDNKGNVRAKVNTLVEVHGNFAGAFRDTEVTVTLLKEDGEILDIFNVEDGRKARTTILKKLGLK